MTYKYKLVDWGRFEEYAGDWEEIRGEVFFPCLFEKLESPDVNLRNEARDTLWQWPIEQVREFGRLGAMPLVIESLLSLANSRDIPERQDFVLLATELRTRADEYHQFTCWYEGSADAFMQSVEEAFEAGLVLFLEFLEDPAPEYRRAAARALGALRRFDPALQLVARLRCEEVAAVRQAIVESLGKPGRYDGLPEVCALLRDDDRRTSFNAAKSVLRKVSSGFREAVDVLVELSMLDHDESGDAFHLAAMSTATLGKENDVSRCYAIDRWFSILDTVPPERIDRFWHHVLLVAFPPECAPTPLSPLQRHVLETLVGCESYWNVPHAFRWLEQVGLPSTRQELGEFLRQS